jgi:branched-chain amino acid transport system permease protein
MLSWFLAGTHNGGAAPASVGPSVADGAPLVSVSMPEPSILAQLVTFAILLGGIYALVALGLTMIFGVMDVINFAHGALMVVGMYTMLYVSETLGIPALLVIPVAVLVLFVVGVLVYRLTIAPIMDAPEENQLIITFGVLLILVSSIELVFGPDPQSLGIDLGSFEVAGIFVPEGQLYALVIALVALASTYLFLQRTMLGRAIRGTADNRDGAQYVGIDVPRIDALTFGIGAGLAGLAGAVVPLFQSFTPFLGDQYLINAFVVVVLGGLGSFPGALLGGLILGFVQVFGSFYLPGSVYQILIFMVFILVLLVKPSGLLGGEGSE